jgi:hypothetical protein
MPRDGAIIFSDLVGKLDVLRVACEKCDAAARADETIHPIPALQYERSIGAKCPDLPRVL